jgi:hypothetical protein
VKNCSAFYLVSKWCIIWAFLTLDSNSILYTNRQQFLCGCNTYSFFQHSLPCRLWEDCKVLAVTLWGVAYHNRKSCHQG